MDQLKLEKLLKKYRDGVCTEEEKSLVESWHLSELAKQKSDVSEQQLLVANDEMWSAIEKEVNPKAPYKIALWLKVVAAAVVIFVIGFVINNQVINKSLAKQELAIKAKKIILPGGNKATLTLGDGSKISLTDAADGVIAKQAGIAITKTTKGELIYSISPNGSSAKKEVYNTIETPRGGQYQINLPDGTKVWLNAASSIKYLAAFNSSDRIVELKGEAYFEVAKHMDKNGNRLGFKVKTDLGDGRSQEVDVLGTHFNINAYANEPANKTTLLEGSINIKNLKSQTSTLLKPGQQSIISAASPEIMVRNVDAEESMTWKDGYFSFNDENLETVMNKVARWYNVDIDYHGNKINKTFGGRISRFNSVNEVLDMLQTTGAVHFKIEERRILVMP